MSVRQLRLVKLFDRPMRSALLASLALPATAVLGSAPGSLVREASACAPTATARSGWQSLAFVHRAGEIATDGFMVIGGVSDIEDAELTGSIELVVTDESGEEVAGQVTPLSPNADRLGRRFLGWSATQPLEVGAKLTAELSTDRVSVGTEPAELRAELALLVVGDPTELSAGSPKFGDWGTFSHGVGESLSCMPGSSGCGPGLPPHDLPSPTNYGYGSVPADEVRMRAAMTQWRLPEIRGNVAWEAAVVLVGDANGAIVPDDRPLVFSAVAEGETPSTGLVVFPADPKDHCIALRVRDLRTGAETQSEPVCGEPGASKFTIADTGLRNCAMPPNDALAKTWCEMHPGSSLEQCRPGYSGNAGGEGSAGAGGTGGTGHEGTDDDVPSEATGSSDSGCSVSSPVGRNGGSALPALLGLALGLGLARGRRNRAKPGDTPPVSR